MHARQVTEFTVEQYLAIESVSLERHEFLDGVILAMAGGSMRHSYCAKSVGIALGVRLAGSRCGVGQSDSRVHVPATGLFTYPDVVVTCGEPEKTKGRWSSLLNPTVLVEVLSKSTAAYDRGEKLDHYKSIPSLQAVLLVSVKHRTVTMARRAVEGWTTTEHGAGSSIELACCGISVATDDFFAQLHLAEADPDDEA